MERRTARALILSLITQIGLTTNVHALEPYEAVYSIEKSGSDVARATYRLQFSDDRYIFTQKTKLIGLASLFRDDSVDERSQLDPRLTLLQYRYHQHGNDGKRDSNFIVEQSTPFRVHGQYADDPFSVETGSKPYDPHSVMLALMHDSAGSDGEYTYDVVRKGSVKTYVFRHIDNDAVEIDEVTYGARHYSRTSNRRVMHVWLSTEHDIPLIIEVHKDDEIDTRLVIDSFRFPRDD